MEIDWEKSSAELDERGNAVVARLLSPEQCRALVGLYVKEDLFRSRVVMARHGFGRGEYRYFDYPLPEVLARHRTALYPRLAEIACLPRALGKALHRRHHLPRRGLI